MPSPALSDSTPFWQRLTLAEMSRSQWEALCDGCGKCCLHKLEDADTGDIYYTNVACRLLDLKTARCKRYPERLRWIPDCTVLKAELVDQFSWLPKTCAYRLLAENKPLPDWHPLVSGSDQTVHEAGISVIGFATDERTAGAFEDHVIDGVDL